METGTKKTERKTMKFEEAMQRVEEIAHMLEDDQLDLDTALKLYEEGKKTIAFCEKKILAAQQKIRTLDDFLSEKPEEEGKTENEMD